MLLKYCFNKNIQFSQKEVQQFLLVWFLDILYFGLLRMCWFVNWRPYTEGKERRRQEADHSSLVGSRFTVQWNLLTRLVLGGCKTNRSLDPPARIVNVYTEAWTRPYRTDGLSNTLLSQGCILGNDPHCGNGGQNIHSKDRGWGEETLPRFSLRVNRRLHLLHDLLNQYNRCFFFFFPTRQ